MQKNMKKILTIMMVAALPCAAFAGGGTKANSYKSAWKNPTMNVCKMSDMGNSSIGLHKDICKGSFAIDANTPGECVLGDDMGVLMLVAREINANGARFCVTTVYAEHKKKGNAWTLYSDAAEATNVCQWLCKPGYSGEGCNANSASTVCDTTLLRRDDFNAYTMKRDPNVEDSVAMFEWNNYQGCGVHKGQEHDIILAVSDWLDSGHGAWARPFVVRARREGWKSKRGGVEVYPAAEPTLLCKSGYKANAAGNDCEPIDGSKCAQSCLDKSGSDLMECVTSQLCTNWPADSFDSSSMTMEYNTNAGCYQYRCKEAGYAYASVTDRTCSPCASDMHGGVSPSDGTCVQCPVGKIFDEKAASTGYCSPTNAYTKTDLQYGKGQTRSSAPTTVTEQCWTIQTPDDYKVCVTSGGTQTTASSSSTSTSRSARRAIRR